MALLRDVFIHSVPPSLFYVCFYHMALPHLLPPTLPSSFSHYPIFLCTACMVVAQLGIEHGTILLELT